MGNKGKKGKTGRNTAGGGGGGTIKNLAKEREKINVQADKFAEDVTMGRLNRGASQELHNKGYEVEAEAVYGAGGVASTVEIAISRHTAGIFDEYDVMAKRSFKPSQAKKGSAWLGKQARELKHFPG